MSLNVATTYFPPGFMQKVATAQTATRGTGANVHDALRSLLFYLRTEHGFTLEDFARLHAAPDSPTRRGDVPESEVARLIDGMFTAEFGTKQAHRTGRAATPSPAPTPTQSPEKTVGAWEGAACCMIYENFEAHGERIVPEESFIPMLTDSSRVAIPEKGYQQFLTALDTLYRPSETISLVTACTPEGSPIANDKSMYPQGWRSQLTRPNNIGGRAGVWWRHNPVSLRGGSGKNGAVTDRDIPEPRYVLLENDVLPRHMQAAILVYLMKRRELPIRCVTDSGGKSLHALVEVAAADYANTAARLLADLHCEFGFDKGNANPSRMSRAPGFVRGIGAKGDGTQRLLYLAPPDGRGFQYRPDWCDWTKRERARRAGGEVKP